MKYLVLLLAVLLFSCKNEETEDNCSDDYVYFKVSEMDAPFHLDSYVLPIPKSDTMNIRIAREIIQYGAAYSRRIISGKIIRGFSTCELLNKDLVSGKTHKWYVQQFDGFSEIAIEVCDSWPGYIDDNLDQWMSELDGAICFWGYSVTEEITP